MVWIDLGITRLSKIFSNGKRQIRNFGKYVVAHQDRLVRFGQDLIKYVIEFNGGKLVVLDQSACSPNEELTKDLLNILHIFSYRIHGLGNYKKQVAQATSNNAEQSTIQPVAESESFCLHRYGLFSSELRKLHEIIQKNQLLIERTWHDYFEL